MTSIPSESNRSFRERALRALHDEAPSDDVRSCFAQDERYCLFASSFVEDKGVEFLIEFPLASGSGTPSSLDARFELRAEGSVGYLDHVGPEEYFGIHGVGKDPCPDRQVVGIVPCEVRPALV